jgi:hypothetical protein
MFGVYMKQLKNMETVFLMNKSTLLLRHVKVRAFVQAGQVISSAFLPRKQDGGFLSVYDGDKISPEDSATNQETVLRSPSLAVFAITSEECQGIGPGDAGDLPACPVPLDDCPEHVHIDFTGLPSKSAYRIAAELLRDHAMERGLLWERPSIP